MKVLGLTVALSLAFIGWVGSAHADPGKDESGKGRELNSYNTYEHDGVPGFGPELSDLRGGYRQPYRVAREFKEEYDDGNCKYERKLKKNGEYKEEIKCRSGYRPKQGASKQKYDDGNCKVERKMDDGEYNEEIKCRGSRRADLD